MGSGKTTCLTNLLKCYKNEKIGIIINEFGNEGIDGKLINQNGFELRELNNGSIFCQCIKGNFINALCSFLDLNISYLFIEASGLADHSNMKTILNTVEKIKGKGYHYAGSICIVDAVYFLKQVDLMPALERQVQYSSVIVINKIDLQTEYEINKIEEKILSLNSFASIIKTSFCNSDIANIVNNLTDLNKSEDESTNTVSSRPYSFVFSIDSCSEFESVCSFIKEVMTGAFRIKGFISLDSGNYQVNSVNDIFQINKCNEDIKYNHLVVISRVGIKIISIITNSAKKYGLKVNIVK